MRAFLRMTRIYLLILLLIGGLLAYCNIMGYRIFNASGVTHNTSGTQTFYHK